MSLCSKRLILFDFFGVLADEVAPKWFSNHIKDKAEANRLKNYYFEKGDLGEYTFKETIENMASDLGYDKDDILNEMISYGKLNLPLLNMVKELRKKNTVCLLSNACDGIFELLFPNLDFKEYFDKWFISCYYKIKKPDLRFYNLAVDILNQEFDEIYFIDDNMNNVSVLENTKIKGIQYTNLDTIMQFLKEFI